MEQNAVVLFVKGLWTSAAAWWALQSPASKLAFFIGGAVVLATVVILG